MTHDKAQFSALKTVGVLVPGPPAMRTRGYRGPGLMWIEATSNESGRSADWPRTPAAERIIRDIASIDRLIGYSPLPTNELRV